MKQKRKEGVSEFTCAGIAWLACCGQQLRNDNRFMLILSAILAALMFITAICLKIRSQNDPGHQNERP